MNDDSTCDLNPSHSNDSLLAEVLATVRAIQGQITELTQRVTALKVETRLYDTRPLWERVLAEIESFRTEMTKLWTEVNGLRAEMAGLRTEVEGLRTEMAGLRSETNKNLRDINRQLEFLSLEYVQSANQPTGLRGAPAST